MGLLDSLNEIHEVVIADPKNVDEKIRQRFWRLVGKIKRQPFPKDSVIRKAAAIRDLLYESKLGKTRSLKWLVLWFLAGMIVVSYLVWMFFFGPFYIGDFWFDIGVMLYRMSAVALSVFLFYPFGRLIAGSVLGIRLDGITRDIYYLPTLKINYVTYLKAKPPRRQWFFFIAGYWTAFTALWVGTIGLLIGGDWIGLIFGIGLGALETLAAIFGGGKWGGELGHFHRERRIVRDWKRALQQ